MTAAARTIAFIVRLRSTSSTRRPVRPAPTPAGGLPPRAGTQDRPATRPSRRRPSRRTVAITGFITVLLGAGAAALVLTMPRMERVGG
ncbi:MAG: hypothetical protein JWM86_2686, partial [Thermoleophilia bacterium]|nr:hypothetical protein [Thermoleophilia bacterium]